MRRREEGRKGRMNDAISLPVQSEDGLARPPSCNVTCFLGWGDRQGVRGEYRVSPQNEKASVESGCLAARVSAHHLIQFGGDLIVSRGFADRHL